ncbi:hypothetical protein ACI75Y_07475 [Capnocytophaga stomatis]
MKWLLAVTLIYTQSKKHYHLLITIKPYFTKVFGNKNTTSWC